MATWEEIRGTLGRNDLPARLADAWEFDEFDSIDELARGLEAAWTLAEFPEHSVSRLDWLAMFDEVGYLEENTRMPGPLAPARLFRGAIPRRRRGMSWTRDLELASWFSRRFGDGGHVWEVEAPPASILARFHELSRKEDEFVLNTFSLSIRRLEG